MSSLRVNFLLPFPVTKPVGGAKVMYEYANRMAAAGHRVTVLHPVGRPHKTASTPVWLKRFIYFVRGASRPAWFPLLPEVESVIIPTATAEHIPDAEATICTWWEMAYMLDRLPESKGAKLNLIQDYEIWSGHEEKVVNSYRLPLLHLCISKHLQALVGDISGREPVYLPNAIDTGRFRCLIAPQHRDPHSLIMLFSTEARKGTTYGLEALTIIKDRYPDLQATLFGVTGSPGHLPGWVSYHRRPPDLAALYNRHAIFVTPSIAEGWALPPAEAMCCGCAVVCTDIGGHRDYAKDGQTAVLVPPENSQLLGGAIGALMADNNKRCSLATAGAEFVSSTFSWHDNTKTLQELIAGLRR
jgi:glycosyltransferase involved in cell wall biosynthesis